MDFCLIQIFFKQHMWKLLMPYSGDKMIAISTICKTRLELSSLVRIYLQENTFFSLLNTFIFQKIISYHIRYLVDKNHSCFYQIAKSRHLKILRESLKVEMNMSLDENEKSDSHHQIMDLYFGGDKWYLDLVF